MNTKDNLRSRTTKKRFGDAYLELLSKDPSRQVTVLQLCQEVRVNRTTFYAHYEDILELQQRIEQRISAEVTAIFRDKWLGEKKISRERLEVLISYIEKNRLFYKAWYLSGRMDEPAVMSLMLSNPKLTNEKRYRILFLRAGTNAVLKDWVVNGCKEDCLTVVSVLAELNRIRDAG